MAKRFSDYAVNSETVVDEDLLNRFFQAIDNRVDALENQSFNWEQAVAVLVEIGLVRIDEALLPVYNELASVGTLAQLFEATSATENTIGTGTKSFIVDSDYLRTFAPTAYIVVFDVDDLGNAMYGKVTSYDPATGELVMDVHRAEGSGTFTDWTFGPVAYTSDLEGLRTEMIGLRDETSTLKSDTNALKTDTAAIRTEAQQARDKSNAWAEQAENSPVETGQFSAKHHAAKAAASAASATAQGTIATNKAAEALASANSAANAAAGLVAYGLDMADLVPYPALLDIDFSSLDGLVGTFTRAAMANVGISYSPNGNGVLVPNVVNEAAIAYEPDAKTLLGSPFFAALTGKYAGGADFDATVWGFNGGSRATVATTGPDGSPINAVYLSDSGSVDHFLNYSNGGSWENTGGSGKAMKAGLFMKPMNGRLYARVIIWARGAGASGQYIAYDLDFSGAVPTATRWGTTTGFTNVRATIKRAAWGWYYLEIAFISISASHEMLIHSASAPGVIVYAAGAAAGQMCLFGAHLVPDCNGGCPPVINVGLVGDTERQPDKLVISGTDFSSFYHYEEFTILAEYSVPGMMPGIGNRVIWSLHNTAQANSNLALVVGAAAVEVVAGSQWGISLSGTIGNVSPDTPYRCAFTFSKDRAAACQNGGTVRQDTSVTPNLWPNKMTIGHTDHSSGGTSLNGYIKRLTYWPKAFSDAELQRVTA